MRSWLLRLAAIAVLLGLSLAVRPERAAACTCGAPPPLAEAFEDSVAIFSGDLVAIRGYSENSFAAVLTFRVSRVWKGSVTETFVMMTSSLGAGDCGFPFESGRAYLVYAYDWGDYELLTAWLCTRTQPLEYAEEDLQFLGKGRLPGPPGTGHGLASDEPATGDQGINVTSPLTVVGLMAALAIALAALASASILKRARQG